MTKKQIQQQRQERRKRRNRAKIFGTPQRPRLTIFRSLKHIYAQIIDDQKGRTLVAVNDLQLKNNGLKKTERAKEVGKKIAQQAVKKGIKLVVFDRGAYKYHGRVKALAEGAREAGLRF